MNRAARAVSPLRDGSRVTIIGGGPAGTFFAFHLLREARQAGRRMAVTIVEKKPLQAASEPDPRTACNACAGVVSPRLAAALAQIGLDPPRSVICESYTHIWIHGLWKNFPLRVPPGAQTYGVFRGAAPGGSGGRVAGFDTYLLRQALAAGAGLITGEARSIGYGRNRGICLTIRTADGSTQHLESDFAAVCIGVNASASPEGRAFLTAIRRINPAFEPPATRRGLIFELHPGRDYLRKYMHRELYVMASGSRRLHLDHIAMVPKQGCLTVALAGERIDRATLPADTNRIVADFLQHPHVASLLPGMDRHAAHQVVCSCAPLMAVEPAKAPFMDRIAMVGDALGARPYRDGLYSAFVAARTLAETVVHQGTDARTLERHCGRVVQWLERDGRYGRLLFRGMRTAFTSPLISRVLYQAFATEMKFRERERWPLGTVLWQMGSGVADDREVCRQMLRAPVIRSVLAGALRTLRNILTEALFGIDWKGYSRYPTVILKEKRAHFKRAIQAPLGITLDPAPDMERMYAIKIRASAPRIFHELIQFGDPRRRFLNLRFVTVRRISGIPGVPGMVVRYSLRAVPVSMTVRLIRSIPGQSLLYTVQELFSRRGRLLFDISPTRDGNHRLVIYTAFDFRRGTGPVSGLFWRCFRRLFPEYAHDVVWNHAICCIKGEAERAEREQGRAA